MCCFVPRPSPLTLRVYRHMQPSVYVGKGKSLLQTKHNFNFHPLWWNRLFVSHTALGGRMFFPSGFVALFTHMGGVQVTPASGYKRFPVSFWTEFSIQSPARQYASTVTHAQTQVLSSLVQRPPQSLPVSEQNTQALWWLLSFLKTALLVSGNVFEEELSLEQTQSLSSPREGDWADQDLTIYVQNTR